MANEQPKVSLSFSCPKKWDEMIVADGGRFCNACNKTVTDYSQLPPNLLDRNIPVDSCGNFKASQLEKPFGNWRDKLITVYQRISLSWRINSMVKKSAISILTLAFIFTGCNKHLRGRVHHTAFKNLKKDKHTTEQTSLTQVNSKQKK